MKNNTNNFANEMMNKNGVLAKHEKTITVYTLPDGFSVEVERGPEHAEFYLRHENYGVKTLMFGILNKDLVFEEELILANVEDYIYFYREDYMD